MRWIRIAPYCRGGCFPGESHSLSRHFGTQHEYMEDFWGEERHIRPPRMRSGGASVRSSVNWLTLFEILEFSSCDFEGEGIDYQAGLVCLELQRTVV